MLRKSTVRQCQHNCHMLGSDDLRGMLCTARLDVID